MDEKERGDSFVPCEVPDLAVKHTIHSAFHTHFHGHLTSKNSLQQITK